MLIVNNARKISHEFIVTDLSEPIKYFELSYIDLLNDLKSPK